MLTPKVEGRFLQALEIDPADEALEIGTGSGFFAACLARLGGVFRSLEILADLCRFCKENLGARQGRRHADRNSGCRDVR